MGWFKRIAAADKNLMISQEESRHMKGTEVSKKKSEILQEELRRAEEDHRRYLGILRKRIAEEQVRERKETPMADADRRKWVASYIYNRFRLSPMYGALAKNPLYAEDHRGPLGGVSSQVELDHVDENGHTRKVVINVYCDDRVNAPTFDDRYFKKLWSDDVYGDY